MIEDVEAKTFDNNFHLSIDIEHIANVTNIKIQCKVNTIERLVKIWTQPNVLPEKKVNHNTPLWQNSSLQIPTKKRLGKGIKHHNRLPRPHEKPHLYDVKTNFMKYNSKYTKIVKRLEWKSDANRQCPSLGIAVSIVYSISVSKATLSHTQQ